MRFVSIFYEFLRNACPGVRMDISLREVTHENWKACMRLKVKAGQEELVADNLYSLAESKFFSNFVPLLAYDGETPVGFCMYSYSLNLQEYWILRLMVAGELQGKGYGRAIMEQLIARIRVLPGCDQIYISYAPENATAEALYFSLGFLDTGKIEDGEKVACLPLK